MMKHLKNTKYLVVFLAGILFSAFTAFAATVTVNTDFTQNAVQYLQQLVLSDASGNTWVMLNGSWDSYVLGNIGIGMTNDSNSILTISGSMTAWYSTIASWAGAFAIGWNTSASGANSISAGNWTNANWVNSFAMGQSSTASWRNSVALWFSSIAHWNNSVAMWQQTQANWWHSLAVGKQSEANGDKSVAIWYSIANWNYSFAAGYWSIASWNVSFSLGERISTTSHNEFAIWKYNTTWTNQIFSIWIGTSTGDRNNAITVTNSGNVGIWINNPYLALEVSGIVKADYFSGDGSLLTNLNITEWLWSTGVSNSIDYILWNVWIGMTGASTALQVSGTVTADLFSGSFAVKNTSINNTWTIKFSGEHFYGYVGTITGWVQLDN